MVAAGATATFSAPTAEAHDESGDKDEVAQTETSEELVRAVQSGDSTRVRLLLSRFANVASVRNGVTALHESVRLARADVTVLLLEAQASINRPTERKDRLTPLHIAAAGGNLHIVELLLAHGADPCAVSGDGRVAAQLAGKLSKVR